MGNTDTRRARGDCVADHIGHIDPPIRRHETNRLRIEGINSSIAQIAFRWLFLDCNRAIAFKPQNPERDNHSVHRRRHGYESSGFVVKLQKFAEIHGGEHIAVDD